MKFLSILLLLVAISSASKLHIPIAYTAEVIVKSSEGGLQFKGSATTVSDGTREHTVTKIDLNGTRRTTESFAFKSNFTTYVIYSLGAHSEPICNVAKVDDHTIEFQFPFEQLNENGEGPGDKCTGPAGQPGNIWKLEDTLFCVSDDGTTPYYLETPKTDTNKSPIIFTAQAPAPSAFQLPNICLDLNTKTLKLPKAYFANSKTEYPGYAKMDIVIRQENGDSVVKTAQPVDTQEYFIASEQKSYSLRNTITGCTVQNNTHNFSDEISSIIALSNLWKHSEDKCLDGEGDVWVYKYSTDGTLCTKSGGTVPVQYKDKYKTVTWTNFRTNDLPAVELPEKCKSA